MKLVKDIGTVITYDNVLSEVRLMKNSYELELTEEWVDNVSVAYQLHNFGWCDIVSVYNYIDTFIATDYNSFSDFEKEYCHSIGLFGSSTLTDEEKRELKQNIYNNFKKARIMRFDKCIDALMYGQEQEDIQIGYTAFHEFGEDYIHINSTALLDYFNSVEFESNVLYSPGNKSRVKYILEI